MKVPLVNLARQYQNIKSEIDEATSRVLESGRFILGKEVEDFENSLADYMGMKHAISVGSGTDALLLSLRAIGLEPDDEVILPTFTFVSPAEVVALLGAKPVFVDVERDSFNIDVSKIESAVTARTKAIMPVHLYGQSADVDEIKEIVGKRGLHIVEDSAQCVGATYKGSKVPSRGHLGAVSFFPTKNLGCFGDGGAVLTNSDAFAKELRAIRSHGSMRKYEHTKLGTNSRLDAIQAAILAVKLKYLDEWNNRRRETAKRYSAEFSSFVEVPVILEERDHIFHQYTIKCEERDKLIEHFKKKGIACAVHYPRPLHLQPAYSYLGYKEGDFPVSEALSKEVLSLPVYPELTEAEIDAVVDGVKSYFK
ncbi:DegT/DnrJ/EryC1/StrS family aminotransferase [candidate division TA06 bacterium]|uniref:DegT/DnrJ/EryC1/StrS family aminotransferase n=2 Tax=candidate division TA06 bacterium TaxID=2250710 RepID=A0A523UUW3_UNCT6|nr:MAG: DegT/DnrJ/EryC1/StrS family aminotransferase [candidate division TA06 bacterium]